MSVQARARATRAAQRTMAKFLSAAEELFGKHGYEGTTIRAISRKARVNLGTLQHYWGSKRELFRDLLERRFRPLQEEHLRRLREIEARVTDGARPEVLDVLRTLVEPTFFVSAEGAPRHARNAADAEDRRRFHLLFGRALMDPSAEVIAEMNGIAEESFPLFLRLLRRACPELSAAELDWRVNCVMGALTFSQVYHERVGRFYGSEADVDDARAASWILHVFMHGVGARPLPSAGSVR